MVLFDNIIFNPIFQQQKNHFFSIREILLEKFSFFHKIFFVLNKQFFIIQEEKKFEIIKKFQFFKTEYRTKTCSKFKFQMPKKKKKGKKGKKKKEYLPPIYDIPAYDNPYETTPKVKLRLILANPPVDALSTSPFQRLFVDYFFNRSRYRIANKYSSRLSGK